MMKNLINAISLLIWMFIVLVFTAYFQSAYAFFQASRSPVAISVKTGSYTIPVGRWARAVVNVEGTGTFTVNGTTALRGTQNNVLASSVLQYYVNGSANTLHSAGGTNPAGSAFSSATDQKTIVGEFNLPTGTVINGSGTWRATVEEYDL